MSTIIPVALSVIFAFASAMNWAHAQESMALRVLGQPLAVGAIQRMVEQPFFETLAKKSGLPIVVDYSPLGSSGIPNVDALSALMSGQVQIASLRISQVGRQEPIFLGLDLAGLNTSYKLGRQVIDAYTGTLDKRLQQKLGLRLFAAWPFGPEILFCNKPIKGLSDLKGLKVRVYDSDSAKFVELVGGVPVQISFAATQNSLSTRAIDCAIGSPTAAISSDWPETTTHVLPIAFQSGINSYGMTLLAWNKLTPEQKTKLSSAFQFLKEELWRFSEHSTDDAINCVTGRKTCASGKKYSLTKVRVQNSDITLLKNALRSWSFPRWAETCDKVKSDCSMHWRRVVGPLVGIK